MEKEYPQLKKLMDSYKSEDALKEFYDKYYIDTIMQIKDGYNLKNFR